jgi:hypothetical protein
MRSRQPVGRADRERGRKAEERGGVVVQWNIREMVAALETSPEVRQLLAAMMARGSEELERRVARLEERSGIPRTR